MTRQIPLPFIRLLTVLLSVFLTAIAFSDEPDLGNCGAMCLYVSLAAKDVEMPDYQSFLADADWKNQPTCSLADISNIAERHGTPGRLVNFQRGQLPEFYGQLIAHVDPEHFVIVSRLADGRISWCDPPSGPRPASDDDLATLSGRGFLLGESPPDSWMPILIAAGGFMLVGVAVVIVRRRRLRSKL